MPLKKESPMQKPFQVWSHGNCPIKAPSPNESGSKPEAYLPNTISAMMIKAEMGVDGIETDICLSKDNELIIYHPGSLDPDPQSLTWKEINERFPWIPSFYDLIGVLAEYPHLNCFLDLKGKNLSELLGLTEALVEKLKRFRLTRRVFLTTSKNKTLIVGLHGTGEVLLHAKYIDPDIRTHLIDPFPFNLAEAGKKYKADIISFGWFNYSFVSKVLFASIFQTGFRNIRKEIKKAQNAGIEVLGGIPDTKEEIEYFVKIGADGVVTNNPAQGIAIRDRLILLS